MSEVTAPSSAKSMSLMRVTRTFVFALSLSRLNNCLSDLVCRYTPSVEVPKDVLQQRRKKTPKMVDARTQPVVSHHY